MKKLIGLLLLSVIQFGVIFYIILLPGNNTNLYPIIVVFSFFIALLILSNDNKLSTSKFSWIFIVLVFPVGGILLYLIFGTGYMSSYKKKLLESSHLSYHQDDHYVASREGVNARDLNLLNYLDNMAYRSSYLHYGGDIECFNYGREKFNRMLEDIDNAKSFIHIEFFIIKTGLLFDEIVNALKKKAAQGVEVRIIVDFVGGSQITKSIIKDLEDHGIKFTFFNELKFSALSRLSNFRDHRKIVVIDGYIAYTGGFNIGDEYIDLSPYYGHWEDFHIRISDSPVVLEYQTFFSQNWFFETKENLFKPKYYPEFNLDLVNKDSLVYPYVDGPDSKETFIRDMFMKAIMGANKSIYIATPYLIPDEALYDSLLIQALSGVEITIVTPGLPDKVYVKLATESYYRDLINVGVKIFEYRGFIHSKKILIDDETAIVGTANFDMRSFNLSFEVCTLILGGKIIKEIKDNFIQAIENSDDARDKIKKQPFYKRILQLVLRVFAPLF